MAEQANSIFVDQSESVVATIGSNYLQNFLSGGNVGKGVGVLTQKRFYYKGKNYSGMSKGKTSTSEEGIVSIEDISFTLFKHTRNTGELLLAIFLTILSPICGFGLQGSPILLIFIPILFAAVLFYIRYFIFRYSLFQISFPGGEFSFDMRYYPISDIQDFQRQLHLLKDHIKNA